MPCIDIGSFAKGAFRLATSLASEDITNVIEIILGGRDLLQTIREIVIAAADRSFEDKRIVRYPRTLAENMQMHVDLGLREQFGRFGLVREPANNQLRVISRHPKFMEPIRLRWCLGQRSGADVMNLRANKGSETYVGIAQNQQQWQLPLFNRDATLSLVPRVWNLWIIYNPTLRNTDVWVALAQEMPRNRFLRCIDIVELGSKRRGDDTIVVSDRTPPQDSDQLKKAIESSFSERLTG